MTDGPRGHRMGGVPVARPNESLKPTGLMRPDAGTTPAMAAGLTGHVWSWQECLTLPAVRRR